MSLMVAGTPSSGPAGSPRRHRSSDARAWARAPSRRRGRTRRPRRSSARSALGSPSRPRPARARGDGSAAPAPPPTSSPAPPMPPSVSQVAPDRKLSAPGAAGQHGTSVQRSLTLSGQVGRWGGWSAPRLRGDRA
jgi:hypothetical protein